MAQEKLEVYIKVNRDKYKLNVRPTDTIKMVKEKLRKGCGLDLSYANLKYNDTDLVNLYAITHYNIQGGSKLHAEESNGNLIIFVRLMDGKTKRVETQLTQTASRLKSKLNVKDTGNRKYSLCFDGKTFKDSDTLATHKVTCGDMVSMVENISRPDPSADLEAAMGVDEDGYCQVGDIHAEYPELYTSQQREIEQRQRAMRGTMTTRPAALPPEVTAATALHGNTPVNRQFSAPAGQGTTSPLAQGPDVQQQFEQLQLEQRNLTEKVDIIHQVVLERQTSEKSIKRQSLPAAELPARDNDDHVEESVLLQRLKEHFTEFVNNCSISLAVHLYSKNAISRVEYEKLYDGNTGRTEIERVRMMLVYVMRSEKNITILRDALLREPSTSYLGEYLQETLKEKLHANRRELSNVPLEVADHLFENMVINLRQHMELFDDKNGKSNQERIEMMLDMVAKSEDNIRKFRDILQKEESMKDFAKYLE